MGVPEAHLEIELGKDIHWWKVMGKNEEEEAELRFRSAYAAHVLRDHETKTARAVGYTAALGESLGGIIVV